MKPQCSCIHVEERSTPHIDARDPSHLHQHNHDEKCQTQELGKLNLLSTNQIEQMVARHKERRIWEDRIEPPRRYFDNQSLGRVLIKEIEAQKVENECDRTDMANSKWFHQLVHSGQFYNPLTKTREMEPPQSKKEISETSSFISLAKSTQRNNSNREAKSSRKSHQGTAAPSKEPYVNVAHMIYDYKATHGGTSTNQKMNRSLAKAIFNRETDFEKLAPVAERLSAPGKSPPPQYGSKLRRKPYAAPESSWVLNSGLCPSQAEAVKRDRQLTKLRYKRMRSEISYGKILRAQQKFATLNKTASTGDGGGGGIFDLTENITQQLNSHIGSQESNQFHSSGRQYPAAVDTESKEVQIEGSDDEEEDGFDALYIKRLLNLFKEKNIPLSVGLDQQKRNKKPPTPKKGQELLLNTTVDNARYQLSDRFKSLQTPKYYNQRRKNQPRSELLSPDFENVTGSSRVRTTQPGQTDSEFAEHNKNLQEKSGQNGLRQSQDESIMQPKEEIDHDLNLRLSQAEVNPDLFCKTDSAFYAFAKASQNQPSISSSIIGRTLRRKPYEKIVPCKAITAKTLNLQPDSPGRRQKGRMGTAPHTSRNPTGKLRLLSYRQIQDQKLEEIAQNASGVEIGRNGRSGGHPLTPSAFTKVNLMSRHNKPRTDLHSSQKDAWTRTFNLEMRKGTVPMVMIGNRMQQSEAQVKQMKDEKCGVMSTRSSQGILANKVSVMQNTVTNSFNFTNQDLQGMELNEYHTATHENSGLKDAAEVTSILQDQAGARGTSPHSEKMIFESRGASQGGNEDVPCMQTEGKVLMLDKEV